MEEMMESDGKWWKMMENDEKWWKIIWKNIFPTATHRDPSAHFASLRLSSILQGAKVPGTEDAEPRQRQGWMFYGRDIMRYL